MIRDEHVDPKVLAQVNALSVWRRVLIGGIGGVLAAAIFSALALIEWIMNDGTLRNPDVTLAEALITYFLWGPVAGVVGGVSFTVTRYPLGAMMVGAFVMMLAYVTISFFVPFDLYGTIFVLVAGGVAGAVGGVIAFSKVWYGDERPVAEEPNGTAV